MHGTLPRASKEGAASAAFRKQLDRDIVGSLKDLTVNGNKGTSVSYLVLLVST